MKRRDLRGHPCRGGSGSNQGSNWRPQEGTDHGRKGDSGGSLGQRDRSEGPTGVHRTGQVDTQKSIGDGTFERTIQLRDTETRRVETSSVVVSDRGRCGHFMDKFRFCQGDTYL